MRLNTLVTDEQMLSVSGKVPADICFLNIPVQRNNYMKTLKSRLTEHRVLPVVTPFSVDGTVKLAKALRAGGIGAIEITLRTDEALEALIAVKEAGIDIQVGVGTVTTAERVHKVAEIGVAFAVSPGITSNVLGAARETGLQLLPGISGPSELMLGIEYGLDLFKLFPASVVGGEKMLKALSGPFPDIKFCPTGGIRPANAKNYLALSNVICVGGSWMVPEDLVKAGEWDAITELSREGVALLEPADAS